MARAKKNNKKYNIRRINTECYKKYKQLVSCITKEDFARKYEELFDKETERKGFYLWILNKLTKAVSDGDINNFKKFDKFIGYINDIESKDKLKDFYNGRKNPIKNSNLVILSCKYKKVEILKYILSNSGILNRLSLDIGKSAIKFNDRDEERHNAFYYSVRSKNVELLDTLINEWPDKYFATHLEQLDGVLSSAYEELKLKNVPLSEEIQIHIENKLINLRFFFDKVKKNKNKDKRLNNNLDNMKKRIKLVLRDIILLKTEYPNTKKVDDKFLFVIKFIAQNVHILKQQLRSTYDKIPWEEIEFCLISFVSSHEKQQELNFYYQVVLNKSKVLDYLESFAEVLGNEKEPEMFTHLPKGARPEIVAKIIDNYPQFKELYTDYQQIKDIYSLQKMKDYLQLASSIDSVQVLNKQGKLTIIRSLQVVGEHLKNTLMSPKLSDCTNEFLLQWLPENTGKVLMGLRNSLSHAQSLARRTEIEENKNEFFIGVQRDIKKIGNMVNTMLHKEKMKVIKALCLQIKNSKYLDEVAEAFFKTGNEFDIIEKEFQTTEFDELEILVEELNKTTEKTKVEEEVFEKISEIIKRLKNKSSDIQLDYLREFHMLKSLIQYFNISDKDSNTINKIKSIAETLYSIPPRTESCDLQEIVKLLNSIPCRTDHFNTVFGIIYSIIEDETEIKWIKDLQTKLKEKVSVTSESTQKENWNTTKEIYNDVLRLKLTELNNVLTDNKLMENSTDDLFFYKTKKKLQSVIEMLVLDIMSILGYEGYLEKNLFFLDDNSPSLTGRSLRNHLAHDNTITNTLSSNPSLNVLLNAVELVFENTMENKKQIGKSTKDDYLKVRNKRSQSLITIVNQQGMFAALEKGCFKDLRSCLRKGADLHARNTNLWTALHFAAKGPNLKIVKFLLKCDLSTNVKNFDGQSPLHIAAANGRTDIVKYFVEGRGFDANETDKYGKTPLDLAKQHDHNDIVKVLLTK